MNGRIAATAVLGAALAATAMAGCGGDDGGDSDSGPAAAVPADSPIYLDASVRPEGAAKTDAEAALGKILDSPDPTGKLTSLIEQDAQGDQKPGETFSFAEDVEPWLGEKVAVFFTSFADDQDPTVVIESTDNDAALDALREDTDATGTEEEYNGATYELDEDGTVFGAVGDFIVSGPVDGFKAAVDANDGDSLGDSDGFTNATGDLSDDRLGTLYADPKDLLAAIPEDDLPAETRSTVEKTGGDALEEPIAGEVTASAEDIELSVSAGSSGVETSESSLLETAPSSAWLAVGIGSLGDAIKQGFEQAESADIPEFDAATIRSQIQLATGQDLDEIADALGAGVIFVEGTAEKNLQGALILQSEDPDTTGELLTRLQSVLQQDTTGETRVVPLASTGGEVGFQLIDRSGDLTQPVQFVQQGDRVVIGYGVAASREALSASGQTLAGLPAFTAAKENLSDLGIDAFLSFAPVFQLAEAEGAGADPDFQAAKPYIDGLDYLALGSGDSDERAELRFVIGLK